MSSLVILVMDEDKTKAGLKCNRRLQLLGEITKQEDMGVKFLAYEIKKQDKGHYVYFELKADPLPSPVLSKSSDSTPTSLNICS